MLVHYNIAKKKMVYPSANMVASNTRENNDMSNQEKKYNVIMPESEKNALCIQIDRVISAEGYAENFLPRLNAIVEEYGEIKILVYYKSYKGWEEDAARQDMLTSAAFGSKVAKIALVNPPEKEAFQRTVKKSLFTAEMKMFEESDLDKAIEWIKSDAP